MIVAIRSTLQRPACRPVARFIACAVVFLMLLQCWIVAGAEQELAIRVLPRKVYPAIVYMLRLEAGESTNAYWSWTVTSGELLSEGEKEVYWKAPPRPGKVNVRVAALDEEGNPSARRAELDITVHRPSTENMVLIPAGTFLMGDAVTDTSDPAFVPTTQNIIDKPARPVYLADYWINRNKVTNRQFAGFLNDFIDQQLARIEPGAVVGIYEGVEVPFYIFNDEMLGDLGGRRPKLKRALYHDGKRIRIRTKMEEHPIMDNTWSGAVAFARYHGKRLPTEAEWEKAARGTDDRRYPWGNELPTRYHANINALLGDNYFPVGSFSPVGDSPYGVADVLGGLEWVDDWFGSYYFQDTYSEIPIRNPRGPMWGVDHPVRGAAVFREFFGNRFNIEPLSFRYQWVFEFEDGHLFAHKDTGFRLALTPLEATTP